MLPPRSRETMDMHPGPVHYAVLCRASHFFFLLVLSACNVPAIQVVLCHLFHSGLPSFGPPQLLDHPRNLQ